MKNRLEESMLDMRERPCYSQVTESILSVSGHKKIMESTLDISDRNCYHTNMESELSKRKEPL